MTLAANLSCRAPDVFPAAHTEIRSSAGSEYGQDSGVVMIREFREADAPVLWTLSTLPNIGFTADPAMPLALSAAAAVPPQFPDLSDIQTAFVQAGGVFLIAEHDGCVVGMGGFRPNAAGQAEVLRLRTHPAMRRAGIGRLVMSGLESRARVLGFTEMCLDTATNQPEAIAFYLSLGYREVRRHTQPEWSWTLAYFARPLS
jgi:GNAT superfamily N-acetyltransferase